MPLALGILYKSIEY